MASNKKTQKVTDQNSELEEEENGQTTDDATNEGDDVVSLNEADLPQTETSEDGDEVTAIEPLAAPVFDLQTRLTKTVISISPHAGQEKVFALRQIELLTGRLKMAIPAGIAAADEPELRSALEALLSLL